MNGPVVLCPVVGEKRDLRRLADNPGVGPFMNTSAFLGTNLVRLPTTGLELSRWRGGRFACYAPHVMPQRSASHWGSRTCSFSKYRKTNSLQMSEKIEFP